VSLADEILSRWAPILTGVALETGTKGRFDVALDGEMIFNKADAGRHAEPGEVVRLLEKRLGAPPHWRKDSR
jgi:selenoprotein W-related protein